MNSFVKPHSISVGYNRQGQTFFDLINRPEYKEYIHSYFLSLNRGLVSEDEYDPYEVADELSKCNRYDIPANLLFNDNISYKKIDALLKIFSSVGKLSAVTLLHPGVAPYIKDTYPGLKIHLSVRFFDWSLKSSTELINQYYYLITHFIDVVNISGQKSYNDHMLFDFLRSHHIKTKMIMNEGCIINRSNNFKKLPGYGSGNCFCGTCDKLCDSVKKDYPWMGLATINIYKETLKFFDYDILKLSSRSLSNELIQGLLDYWTDENPTRYIYLGNNTQIDISKNYDVFLNWIEAKSVCIGDCWDCKRCIKFYKDLTSE